MSVDELSKMERVWLGALLFHVLGVTFLRYQSLLLYGSDVIAAKLIVNNINLHLYFNCSLQLLSSLPSKVSSTDVHKNKHLMRCHVILLS